MLARRFLKYVLLFVPFLVAGCGGGGSSTSSTPADDPPPANGSYAGTYKCASTSASADLTFTAVLPTANGVLSSCSGSAEGGALTITCSGSIAADGKMSITGSDSHGNSLTFSGEATSSLAAGTFTIAPANIAGNFQCTH